MIHGHDGSKKSGIKRSRASRKGEEISDDSLDRSRCASSMATGKHIGCGGPFKPVFPITLEEMLGLI